ncbi:MAG: alpha-amylase/4-alpha-glucanotransferase domain-containing protein [Terriglobia bacterium]
MHEKVSLCLLMHSHQPVGNFDHVIEKAFQDSYQPFLNVLRRHPGVRLSLHFSGILLRWLEEHHPEFIDQLRELSARGQVEHVGGGFYEPILAAIAPEGRVTQIRRQSEYLRERFGAAPEGAWIAERVWEQGLIPSLVAAGVRYTVLDHTHFLGAGLEGEDLHQAYLTEESALPLTLVPSLQSLRYTIPFREPGETLSILRSGLNQKSALFAVGDDCEKFGVWPGTYEHCYTHGWLDQFFEALESARDWLNVTTLSDYLAAHRPTRRVYLPSASYPEMMSWALPAPASAAFQDCLEETHQIPQGERFRRFLCGAPWLSFMSKYPESNQTQKLVLRGFRRWRRLCEDIDPEAPENTVLREAQDHLLAAQCNDAYWHGIFGGLYSPHLRSAVLRHLIHAEVLMDRAGGLPAPPEAAIQVEDFDVDGREEVLVECSEYSAVVRPGDGGTISSMRYKPARLEVINSLMRRPEAYHRQIGRAPEPKPQTSDAPVSIHDQVRTKGTDFASRLQYDRYARHAFRTYLFPARKSFTDFDRLALEECEELAGGEWKLGAEPHGVADFSMTYDGEGRVAGAQIKARALKRFSIRCDGQRWSTSCQHSFFLDSAAATPWAAGVEMVFNLLAPNSPDRYFEADGSRYPLEWKGELVAPQLSMTDEWQRVQITLEAPGAARWWIAPVETISQSESGIELVYQGSSVMAVWECELGGGREAQCSLTVQIQTLA